MQDGDTFLIRATSNRTEEIALVYLAHIIKYRKLPHFSNGFAELKNVKGG
jgi:hypothetical protein